MIKEKEKANKNVDLNLTKKDGPKEIPKKNFFAISDKFVKKLESITEL